MRVQHDRSKGCIYCGSDNGGRRLTDEHVLPKMLKGDIILSGASCAACQEVTRDIETYVGRKFLHDFRVARGMRKGAPSQLPLPVFKDGEWQSASMPADVHPAALTLPLFPFPGILVDRKDDGWPTWYQEQWYRHVPPEALATVGTPRYKTAPDFEIEPFVRMLAKVAHGMAVVHYGIDGFLPYLPGIILGSDRDFTRLVGSIPQLTPPSAIGEDAHYCDVAEIWKNQRRLVVVRIRLFAGFGGDSGGYGTPHFLVAAGERPRPHDDPGFLIADQPLGPLISLLLRSHPSEA